MYDDSLTKTNSFSIASRHGGGMAAVGEYILYGGGTDGTGSKIAYYSTVNAFHIS